MGLICVHLQCILAVGARVCTRCGVASAFSCIILKYPVAVKGGSVECQVMRFHISPLPYFKTLAQSLSFYTQQHTTMSLRGIADASGLTASLGPTTCVSLNTGAIIASGALAASSLSVTPALPATTAQISIANSNALGASDARYVDFVPAATAGGLTAQHKQTFCYVDGAADVIVSDILPSGVTKINRGTLDVRMGSFTTTGALQVVPCAGILATSGVRCALVGTADAAGFANYAAAVPAPIIGAIVPGVSFEVTGGAADLIYQWEAVN